MVALFCFVFFFFFLLSTFETCREVKKMIDGMITKLLEEATGRAASMTGAMSEGHPVPPKSEKQQNLQHF